MIGLYLSALVVLTQPADAAATPPATCLLVAPARGRRLSDIETASLLHCTGWRGRDLETATRIVLGESGANPRARNLNRNGTRDRGLFQINDGAHPDLSDREALDPVRNSHYAFGVYKRQKGFRPGRSAWWGSTKFHTLRKGKPDRKLVRRAAQAVAVLRHIGIAGAEGVL